MRRIMPAAPLVATILAPALLGSCSIAQAAEPSPLGDNIASTAKSYIDGKRRGGKLVRRDCSGFVITVLRDVGVRRSGGTRHFWARADDEDRVISGRPAPGDLAFFDETYDADGDGDTGDELTHMAIVVETKDDGTVRLAHRGSKGPAYLWMNLEHPDEHKNGRATLNSFLRSPGYGPKDGPRLSGQLFRGFARPPR